MKNIKFLVLPVVASTLCSMSPVQNNIATSKILGLNLENVTNVLQKYEVINLGTVRETETGTNDLVAEEFFKYEAFELKKITPQFVGKFIYLVTEFKFNLNQKCSYMCGFMNLWKGEDPVSHKTGTIGLKINNNPSYYYFADQSLLEYEKEYRLILEPRYYGSYETYDNQIAYMAPDIGIYDASEANFKCKFKTTSSNVSTGTKGEYNYRIHSVSLDGNGSLSIKNAQVFRINDLANMRTMEIQAASKQLYNLGRDQIGNKIHEYQKEFVKTISIKLI